MRTTSMPNVRGSAVEKRVIRIFSRFVEIFESRMTRGVLHHLRPQLFTHQPRQAFVQSHADAPDAFRAQSHGGGQHQRVPIGFQQVHGADVGFETALDELDDVAQRFRRVAAMRDQAADFFQGPQERCFLAEARASWSRHAYCTARSMLLMRADLPADP
jgi:hypothetical protein